MASRRGAPAELLADPETRRAVGLAAAVMGGNVVALGFTVVFARHFGSSYGSLAALLSAYIILMVPGSAVQVAVARGVSSAVAKGDPHAGASVRRWLRGLLLLAIGVTVVSILGRNVIAAVIGVHETPWGAAAALPAGALWLIVCVERGALQGFGGYRPVGLSIVAQEISRLIAALVLVTAGLGVAGAFVGTAASLATVGIGLAWRLQRELPPREIGGDRLRDLLRSAAIPMLALSLIAWLQDGNVIIVKHIASRGDASAWGAAAVAAKAIMWMATGLALYVVPEAAKRTHTRGDPRGPLVRAAALIAAIAVPMVVVYAVAAHPLLHAVFKLTGASAALPWLAIAMSTLACTYLATQYQLALHRWRFIALLVVAAIAQPLVMAVIGARLTGLALGVLAVDLPLAVALFALAMRRPSVADVAATPEAPEPTPVLSEA